MLVLIAPLDWGLGHATRCIPLIRALERAGHTVVACAAGAGARLLRAEFPHLTVEEIPGHAMTYTKQRALLPAWLLAQLPLYLLGVWRERRAARRLARRHGAGLIIADGRYGFRAPGIPAVFVTHQLEIVPPGPAWLRAALAPLLRRLNTRALRGFSEVWVPDFAGPVNLSGTLGHPAARGDVGPPGQGPGGRQGVAGLHTSSRLPGPDIASGVRVAYIRPLCRFRPVDAPWTLPRRASSTQAIQSAGPAAPPLDILALVSGPEPQRSLFEQKLRTALETVPGTHVLVRGVPGARAQPPQPPTIRAGALTVFDHVPGERLAAFLEAAGRVVCRSGYTTMMELAGVAQANVLLVPTPGQPEQEMLAVHARRNGYAAWQDQDALDVDAGLHEAASLPGFGKLTGGGGGEGERGEGPAFILSEWVAAHPLLAERPVSGERAAQVAQVAQVDLGHSGRSGHSGYSG